MTLSMYQAAVPVFVRALDNLAHVLKKGEEHAKSKNVSDESLLQTRLIPDMLPLVKQVQIACDMATRGIARLAGVEPQSFEDNETTLEQAHSRIDRAIAYIQTFSADADRWQRGPHRGAEDAQRRDDLRRSDLPAQLRDSQPVLPLHHRLQHPARERAPRLGKSDFIGGA